ncbi:hypothetical protein ACFW2S_31990, partial [Streptomyces sp. NPDC058874]
MPTTLLARADNEPQQFGPVRGSAGSAARGSRGPGGPGPGRAGPQVETASERPAAAPRPDGEARPHRRGPGPASGYAAARLRRRISTPA